MTLIPIRLQPLEVHIHADRRLAFQVITAFGAAGQEGEASSRVLSREEDRLLVEFQTPGPGLFGRRKVYRTVEWVTAIEPERVEFETVDGPLSMMRDRFILEEQAGCTLLRYESEFGTKGWVAPECIVRKTPTEALDGGAPARDKRDHRSSGEAEQSVSPAALRIG